MTLNPQTLSGLQNTYLEYQRHSYMNRACNHIHPLEVSLFHNCIGHTKRLHVCAAVNMQQCFLAKCAAMLMIYRSTHRTITSSINTNKRKSKYTFCAASRYGL